MSLISRRHQLEATTVGVPWKAATSPKMGTAPLCSAHSTRHSAQPFAGSDVHGKQIVINKFGGASADSEIFHTNIKQNLTPVMGKVYTAPDFSSFLVPLVRCQKCR